MTLGNFRYIFNNMKYKDRRTMDFIHHMRRSAISAGRPGGLIREITWKGNIRVSEKAGYDIPEIVERNTGKRIHAVKSAIHAIGIRKVFSFFDI